MVTFPGAVQYPVSKHSVRRFKPVALLVVHITGNAALPNALGEAKYSNRTGSTASFGFVTNRDGSIVQCMDPATAVSWTTGSINHPNPALASVRAMIGSAYGPNFWVYAQCENVGFEPGSPITAAQVATLSRLAAWASKLSGLPVNRNTVLGHRDFNSVDRHDCPTSGDLEKLLARVIAGANAILHPEVFVRYEATIPAGARMTVFAVARYSHALLAPKVQTFKTASWGTLSGSPAKGHGSKGFWLITGSSWGAPDHYYVYGKSGPFGVRAKYSRADGSTYYKPVNPAA